MLTEELVSLECPYCRGELYQALNWFKQPYFTCPACGGGLAAGQFAAIIDELEEAFETEVATMVQGAPASGCCGGKGKCCG